MNPDDRSIRFLRARCLTRLEQYDEAKEELDNLEGVGYRSYLINHAKGLLMREQGNIEQAVFFFKHGLDDRPDYIPLLRDLGDGLDKLEDKEGAIKVLRQAYELAPRDQYVLPTLVDVLANNGNIKEALSIIEEAVAAFPEEAGFEHRISTLLSMLGRDEESYSHAKRAVELDGTLYEAKLHFASLEGRRGNLEVAENLLKELPQELPKRFRRVRDTIRAEIKLKHEQYEAARELIKRYDVYSDPYLADVASRIELSDAMAALGKSQLDITKGRLKRGREIIEPALRKFPENQKLQQTCDLINAWEAQLKKWRKSTSLSDGD